MSNPSPGQRDADFVLIDDGCRYEVIPCGDEPDLTWHVIRLGDGADPELLGQHEFFCDAAASLSSIASRIGESAAARSDDRSPDAALVRIPFVSEGELRLVKIGADQFRAVECIHGRVLDTEDVFDDLGSAIEILIEPTA